jgi:hypothetical protein
VVPEQIDKGLCSASDCPRRCGSGHAGSLEFFSGVSDLDIDDRELASVIRPTSTARFKIHMVGTPGTIAALSIANYELTAAAARLMSRRAHLRSIIASGALDARPP